MTAMETLRINVATADDIIADLEAGRNVGEAVYSFPTWEALHATLTPNRVALLAALKGKGATTMREAARLVRRDYRPVHADIAALLKVGILDRTAAGIVFPFADLHIDVTGVALVA
jgi:predicted transcriptional regulator